MSTQPTVHKPAVTHSPTKEAAKDVSANVKDANLTKEATKHVDPDRVFRADGTEDTNATKERKLKKIAARRVPKAIVALRMVGQLGAYKPNPEQQAKILKVLRESFAEMERRLTMTVVKSEDSGFVL